MPLNRFSIHDPDHAKFGALIKKWARGTIPMPGSDPDDLKRQLVDEGISANWPTGKYQITEVNVFQGVPEKLDLRVPPKELLKESEAFIAVNNYPLPSYYEDLFGVSADFSDVDPIEFHNARVGDYTAANCG